MTIAKPLVITPGCPAGIGLDTLLQLAAKQQLDHAVIVTDPVVLHGRAKQIGLNIDWEALNNVSIEAIHFATPCIPGIADIAHSSSIIKALEIAVDGCLSGRFHGMVTGPINKAMINSSGIPFTGHTEWIAERCQTPKVVMMLATKKHKVALVTTHIPLKDVAACVTGDSLKSTLQIVQHALQQNFQLSAPKIIVTGLNPHAGEQGYLGREEIDVIIPALNDLRKHGYLLIGPLAADTVFQAKYLNNCDCIVAMYHDQGLAPIKTLGFGQCVNITLGLPIIRTSVDHGTAYDIAGSGQSDPGSLQTAIDLARALKR